MDFIFTSLAIKRLIYLLLVTLLAFVAEYQFANSEAYWLLWTALALSLLASCDTFMRTMAVICLTGVVAALLAYLAAICAYLMPLLAIYLLIITITCMYLGQHYPKYFLSALMINLLTLLSGGLPATLADYGHRLLFILAGTGMAAGLYLMFWPYFTRNKLQSYLVLSLRHLMQLNNEIFSCYLQPDYSSNIYLFERRLHLQKDKCLVAMRRLFNIIQLIGEKNGIEKNALLNDLFRRLNLLYDLMLDYSQLRWRVTDHSTFAVCDPELTAILNEMNLMFREAISLFAHQSHQLHTARLQETIQKLDDNYQSVLRVAAREPLVFLLFIASLKSFAEEIGRFRDVGLKVRLKFLWSS